MSRSNNSPESEIEKVSDELDEGDYISPSRDKANSPAVSYNSMASDQSINLPVNFGREPDVMRFHKAASPSPTLASVQSEQSLDPPDSFKSSPSRDKADSPAVSYILMASDQSMNLPLKFSREPVVMRFHKAASPSPTLASVQSEQSLDPPDSFTYRLKVSNTPSPRTVGEISPGTTSVRSEQSTVPTAAFEIWESCTSRMMREHLRCLVCKYTLKEPVSIPCGHSFCKTCIQSCWTKPAHAGSFPCPQCRKRFKTLPELNLNLTLANVVLTQQQARDSPALLAQTYAGPGDVACDVCSGREIRAVKSCATCRVSYCEAHVKEHYTVGALLKHTLTEPGHDPDTSSEDVPKDQMGSMVKQMTQLQNKVDKIEEKLEDMEKCVTGAQHPAPLSESLSQVCDFAVPETELLHYFSD